MTGGATALLVGLVVLVVALRVLMGFMNHARIRRYIERDGGEVVHIGWAPFGPGWFGSRDTVVYRVRYADAERRLHDAHCRTGLFAGVYFTEDRVIGKAEDPLSRFH